MDLHGSSLGVALHLLEVLLDSQLLFDEKVVTVAKGSSHNHSHFAHFSIELLQCTEVQKEAAGVSYGCFLICPL